METLVNFGKLCLFVLSIWAASLVPSMTVEDTPFTGLHLVAATILFLFYYCVIDVVVLFSDKYREKEQNLGSALLMFIGLAFPSVLIYFGLLKLFSSVGNPAHYYGLSMVVITPAVLLFRLAFNWSLVNPAINWLNSVTETEKKNRGEY